VLSASVALIESSSAESFVAAAILVMLVLKTSAAVSAGVGTLSWFQYTF